MKPNPNQAAFVGDILELPDWSLAAPYHIVPHRSRIYACHESGKQTMNAHKYLLNDAIRNIHEAQHSLVLAGLGTSPSFYRLTTVRLTLERRVKNGAKPPKCKITSPT